MNNSDSSMAANAICHAAYMVQETAQAVISQFAYPQVMFKPKLFMDGDCWCALLGDNLQDGVAGFGKSPADAMNAFDTAWYTAVVPKSKEVSSCPS